MKFKELYKSVTTAIPTLNPVAKTTVGVSIPPAKDNKEIVLGKPDDIKLLHQIPTKFSLHSRQNPGTTFTYVLDIGSTYESTASTIFADHTIAINYIPIPTDLDNADYKVFRLIFKNQNGSMNLVPTTIELS